MSEPVAEHIGTLSIAELIKRGWLVPVEVFGNEDCCEHNPGYTYIGLGLSAERECPSQGHGLSDRFSTHAPGGSDCNRAERFLLRPSDEAMSGEAVPSALAEVLEDPPQAPAAVKGYVACGGCKWWQYLDYPGSELSGLRDDVGSIIYTNDEDWESVAPPGRWGFCKKVGEFGPTLEDKFYVKDGSEYYAALHTRADFGCTEGEASESGEASE